MVELPMELLFIMGGTFVKDQFSLELTDCSLGHEENHRSDHLCRKATFRLWDMKTESLLWI